MSGANYDTVSMESECSLTLEHQLKMAMEENRDLKSYINSMNNECLELNAALFDEANKMVLAARRSQEIAEKLWREKSQENEMLRLQVEALRVVIERLPSPVLNAKSPCTDDALYISRRAIKGKRTTSLPRITTKAHVDRSKPTLYRMACGDLSLLFEQLSGPMLTKISRSTLLDALLSDNRTVDEKDQAVFYEFHDWLLAGCPLHTPNTSLIDGDEDHSRRESVCQRIATNNKMGECKEPNKVSTSTVILNSSPSPRVSSTVRPDSSVHNEWNFLHRIYKEDVYPCLDFNGSHLQKLILLALPKLALEMVPLNRLHQDPVDSNLKDAHQYCPLLPSLEPSYRLTLQVPDGNNCSQPEHIVAEISATARHRIAAVVSLFQYLTFISRGDLALIARDDSLTTRKTDQAAHESSGRYHVQQDYATLAKEFTKLQRLRLIVAFARLGFGLPDCD